MPPNPDNHINIDHTARYHVDDDWTARNHVDDFIIDAVEDKCTDDDCARQHVHVIDAADLLQLTGDWVEPELALFDDPAAFRVVSA